MNDQTYNCPTPDCDTRHHVDIEAVEWNEHGEASLYCFVCDRNITIAKPVSQGFGGSNAT